MKLFYSRNSDCIRSQVAGNSENLVYGLTLNLRKSINKLFFLFSIVSFLFLNGVHEVDAQIKNPLKVDAAVEANIHKTLKQNAQTIQFMENKGQVPIPEVKYLFSK
ncbi:MAG: hypothetical protein IPH93_16080 [Saprospiraceae bacterium]|nr:hypothetical protein [Saprospiraceae bacterium]